MYNCMLIDYRTMLEKGFVLGNALISTPNSFGVACTLCSQIVQGVACSQYGGQTLNRLDEGLAPYVTKSYIKIINSLIEEAFEMYNINYKEPYKFEMDDKFLSIESINSLIGMNCIFDDNNSIDKDIVDRINESIVNIALKKIGKEVYDGIQCLEYQINTLYTTNG